MKFTLSYTIIVNKQKRQQKYGTNKNTEKK